MCSHYQAEKRRKFIEQRYGITLPPEWEPPHGGSHIYPTQVAPIIRRPAERDSGDVLPHEGMLPVGQLSFLLFFAWLLHTFAGMPLGSYSRPRIISFARSARQAWTLRCNVRNCAFPA
jgi:hypothetical protein